MATDDLPDEDPLWFSATLRLVSFTEDRTFSQESVSVFTFVAADHDDAFQKALALGRREERTFVNGDGVRLRRAFVSVETVNGLGETVDGVEVFYWPGQEKPSPYAWDHRFSPEESSPYTAL